jgi:hypothetical protein
MHISGFISVSAYGCSKSKIHKIIENRLINFDLTCAVYNKNILLQCLYFFHIYNSNLAEGGPNSSSLKPRLVFPSNPREAQATLPGAIFLKINSQFSLSDNTYSEMRIVIVAIG